MKSKALKFIITLGLFLLVYQVSSAQQMVFRFTNPAFGGNPLNYSWLLNSANAQNRFQTTNNGLSALNRDPLADFQQSLQRQVLSQLTREIVTNRFGNVDFSQEGTFEFGEFTINILPSSNGVDVSILNILTGDETTITVPNI
jgi:curli production assembly/transport component CsgF